MATVCAKLPEATATEVRRALAEFEMACCPGVPTIVIGEQRFFGKDRVDWVRETCLTLLTSQLHSPNRMNNLPRNDG